MRRDGGLVADRRWAALVLNEVGGGAASPD
jgi:hypothetical protein